VSNRLLARQKSDGSDDFKPAAILNLLAAAWIAAHRQRVRAVESVAIACTQPIAPSSVGIRAWFGLFGATILFGFTFYAVFVNLSYYWYFVRRRAHYVPDYRESSPELQ
jgi:hypothetical protein